MNTRINTEVAATFQNYLLAMADDELVLGHRDSEWCGHAPILEEDIAFANIALDEIGHAAIWYALAAQFAGEDPDTYPDQQIFFREPEEFRNSQLVEQPKGDWAFSMLRQYLFDAAEKVWLAALKNSTYTPLAEAAAKISTEELYHLRHTRAWIRRLGFGSKESHRRLQAALEILWPLSGQLFVHHPEEEQMVQNGYVPAADSLRTEWENLVIPYLETCSLTLPKVNYVGLSRIQHTDHLTVLVTEMQSVARLEPEGKW
jgi:ring-1,2-phenylacetyl-CoA epoxidase subunit PaaC